MEKGRVVIFGAGAGLPYFSTDTVAAQRARDRRRRGARRQERRRRVYTADPKKDARLPDRQITYRTPCSAG
jgi:uridylate kinase